MNRYATGIYLLKKYMNDRKAFDLRTPLIVWNFLLTTFSAIGAYRGLNEFSAIYSKYGLTGTVCHNGALLGATGFWMHLFVLSKVIEFGDTVFIILRKKPLQFLHYYHHLETCFVSFFIYSNGPLALARYFGPINLTVHTFMYGYYTLAAMGLRAPKHIAMIITLSQTMQMFICLMATSFALIVNDSCDSYGLHMKGTELSSIYVMIFTYLVYAVLFTRLFYNLYIINNAKKADKKL